VNFVRLEIKREGYSQDFGMVGNHEALLARTSIEEGTSGSNNGVASVQ
jgi:hypothetical protein